MFTMHSHLLGDPFFLILPPTSLPLTLLSGCYVCVSLPPTPSPPPPPVLSSILFSKERTKEKEETEKEKKRKKKVSRLARFSGPLIRHLSRG